MKQHKNGWIFMRRKISEYIEAWKLKGYPDDIPDEVPHELMKLGLAPSYKAICLAILSNDVTLSSLGFSGKVTPWYGELKRIELTSRNELKRMDDVSKTTQI